MTSSTLLTSILAEKRASFRHSEQQFINEHVMNRADRIMSYFTIAESSSPRYSFKLKISSFSGRDLFLQVRNASTGDSDSKMQSFLKKTSSLEVRSTDSSVVLSNSRHFFVLLSRTGWQQASDCMLSITRVNRTFLCD
jgi:hypothetical protein